MKKDSSDPGIPDYLEHYNLDGTPFSNKPDERFFYASNAIKQRLDLLTHLTQFGETVIVVTGPTGSGKTTLLNRFNEHAKDGWLLCPCTATQVNRFQDALAIYLGGNADSSTKSLITNWMNSSAEGELLVVMVDDADQLDDLALEQLSILFDDSINARARLILFGTQNTVQLTKHALEKQLFKGSTQLLEVPRLSEEEAAAYLEHRLAIAGFSGESPFSSTEVRAICKSADGRPADTNRLAHRCLLEGYARVRSRELGASSSSGKRSFSVPLLMAAVAIVGGFFGWRYLNPENDGLVDVAENTQMQTLPLPDRVVATAPQADHTIPGQKITRPETGRTEEILENGSGEPADPIKYSGAIARTETGETPATAIMPAAAPATEKNQPVLAEADTGTQKPAPASAIADDKTVIKATDTIPATEAIADKTPVETDKTIGKAAVAKTAAVADKKIDAPVENKATAAEESPEKAQVKAPQKTPVKAPEKAPEKTPEKAPVNDAKQAADTPVPAGDKLSRRESWLLKQKPGDYTLQLLGVRNEQSMRSYIKRNRLDKGKAAYYKSNYKGKEWYVLVYGAYPNQSAAARHIKELPSEVRKGKPWPRRFAPVQKEINDFLDL